jgi:hypothetical protein
MNAWLPWRPEARISISPAVRRVLQHGTRVSSRFFSSIGLTAVLIALVLWVQPGLRAALAARLMPVLSAASAATGPDVSRWLSFGVMRPFGAPAVRSGSASDNPLQQAADNNGDADAQSAGNAIPLVPWSKLGPAENIVMDAQDTNVMMSVQQQNRVANFLSRRYHVAETPVDALVHAAFDTGHEVGLDPLLLLAVMAIESGFNPYAESGVGAQGLMQVMSKVHSDKFSYFGGTSAALEPLPNIRVGALVLKDCIARGGSVAAGLRLYVGSTSVDDGGYGAKVMAERTRLRDVARGMKVSITSQQTAMVMPLKTAPLQTGAAATSAEAPEAPAAAKPATVAANSDV